MSVQISRSVRLFLLVLGMGLLSGCTSIDSYVPGYLQALNQYPQSTAVTKEDITDRFVAVYGDLDNPNIADLVANLYAEELYFNDTLHTFTNRSTLTDYLVKTGQNIGDIGIEIDAVTITENDIYLRWIMAIRYETLNDGNEIKSIGISHLRVDDNGYVVMQQDFWDGVDAFYKHVPLLGNLIDMVRNRL